MTTATATPLMTAEEFGEWVELPENLDKWFELVEGKVIELPLPTKIHGRVCQNVAFNLELYVRQRQKGYLTTNDSGVILRRHPDSVRAPDVALYEDADCFSELHPKYGQVAPRLAVEVLSPNDKAIHILRKIADYLQYEVELVWVVDPHDRSVTIHTMQHGPRLRGEQDELDGGEVLPGFRCKVADFFFMPGEGPVPTA